MEDETTRLSPEFDRLAKEAEDKARAFGQTYAPVSSALRTKQQRRREDRFVARQASLMGLSKPLWTVAGAICGLWLGSWFGYKYICASISAALFCGGVIMLNWSVGLRRR